MNDTNERFGFLEKRQPLPPEIQTRPTTQDAAQVSTAQASDAQASTAQISAALLEFDALGRLTFATREAQTLLGFALEPLWGRSVAVVMTRLQQIGAVEHIAGGRINRAPATQLTATEHALGVLHASLELRLVSHPLEPITLRFRGLN